MTKTYLTTGRNYRRSLFEKPRKRLFTLDYPSYVPFVTYADNRELRKKMAIALAKVSRTMN
jgi:Zn-dependent oligopeptidase